MCVMKDDFPLLPFISISQRNVITLKMRSGMEGSSADLLAGRTSRKAKKTKGKLTRQKETSDAREQMGRGTCKELKNLTEGQGKNKDNFVRKPGMKSGKLELKRHQGTREKMKY